MEELFGRLAKLENSPRDPAAVITDACARTESTLSSRRMAVIASDSKLLAGVAREALLRSHRRQSRGIPLEVISQKLAMFAL